MVGRASLNRFGASEVNASLDLCTHLADNPLGHFLKGRQNWRQRGSQESRYGTRWLSKSPKINPPQ